MRLKVTYFVLCLDVILVFSVDSQIFKREPVDHYDNIGASVSETYNSLDGFGRRIQQHSSPQEIKTFNKYEHNESPYTITYTAENHVPQHHHVEQQQQHHEYHAHDVPQAEYHHHTPEETEYHHAPQPQPQPEYHHEPQQHHLHHQLQHHHHHHHPGKLYEEIPVPEIPPRLPPPKKTYSMEIIRSEELISSPYTTKPGFSASQSLFDDVKIPDGKERYILIPLNSVANGGKSEEVLGSKTNYLQSQTYPLHLDHALEYHNLPIPDGGGGGGIGSQEILFKNIESEITENVPTTTTLSSTPITPKKPTPTPTPTTTTTPTPTTTTKAKPTQNPKMSFLAAIIQTLSTLS